MKPLEMETKYSAKIRELLEGKLDDETFKTWLMEQPMLDQAEIFREIKNTIDSEINLEENPIPEFETLDFFIDDFEDTEANSITLQYLASSGIPIKVKISELYEKIGYAVPDANDEVIELSANSVLASNNPVL